MRLNLSRNRKARARRQLHPPQPIGQAVWRDIRHADVVQQNGPHERLTTLSFRDGRRPDLGCAIAHLGISRFRVRRLASPRNDGMSKRPLTPLVARGEREKAVNAFLTIKRAKIA